MIWVALTYLAVFLIGLAIGCVWGYVSGAGQ